MILEEMFNGRFYPCETVVADSLRFKQATKAKRTMLWLKNCGSKWQSLSARKTKATSNTAFRRGYLSKRKPMSKWRREKKSSIPIVAVLILSTATLLP